MEKIKLGPKAVYPYPMPMALVGATVDKKPNFLAVAWLSRVNMTPPIMAVSLGRKSYTLPAIEKNGVFSICFPGIDLMEEADFCGIYSGLETDKSNLFNIFFGQLEAAPMIKECPLCMECKLVQTVELQTNNLYLGEIVAAYAEERYMTGGKLDISKMNAFVLTMPDNNYWKVGHHMGKAWDMGRHLFG
jgi:flavin reductase (DIM6/NTAB) family NADH-FMN oxidoreductase RutF